MNTPKFLCLVTLLTFVSCGEIKVTDQIYFDVAIDGQHMGRIIIGLFGETAPKTVANFITIATEGIDGRTYAGTKFHRVIERFMIQGGDIISNDGTGSISIYGDMFPDENFDVKHTAAGFISMANSGPDTNGCQFFITTMETPWLDGRHTVFGQVVKGQGIVHKIEHLRTDIEDRPKSSAVIVDCGLIPTPKPFYISDRPNELTLWAWLEAGWFPLSFSIAIMVFFSYIIKLLDSYKLPVD